MCDGNQQKTGNIPAVLQPVLAIGCEICTFPDVDIYPKRHPKDRSPVAKEVTIVSNLRNARYAST